MLEKADIDQFNQRASGWAKKVTQQNRGTLRSLRAKRTGDLLASVQGKAYRRKGLTDRIGFSFNRSGVFVETGVGKGRPANSIRARKAAKPWFNRTLEENMGELADIAADAHASINANRIFIR